MQRKYIFISIFVVLFVLVLVMVLPSVNAHPGHKASISTAIRSKVTATNAVHNGSDGINGYSTLAHARPTPRPTPSPTPIKATPVVPTPTATATSAGVVQAGKGQRLVTFVNRMQQTI